VPTAVKWRDAPSSNASHATMPGPFAPATPTTCASASQRARIGSRFGSDCGSTNAAFAPLCCSRYSSASGPNRNESGTVTAPSW
jgi:hypothetical protein